MSDYLSEYKTEYARLCADPKRAADFITSGKSTRRIFPPYSSNIRTISTICSYAKTMYDIPIYPKTEAGKKKVHEKNNVTKECRFRSIDNHTDSKAIIRSDILTTVQKKFVSKSKDSVHSFVKLIVYLLLLDIDIEGKEPDIVVKCAEAALKEIPRHIKLNLFQYIKDIKIKPNASLKLDNILQLAVIHFGDKELYTVFGEFIHEHYPDKEIISELCKFVKQENEDKTSPIYKRRYNHQASALKDEACYLALYFAINKYITQCKLTALRTGKIIVDAKEFLFGMFDSIDTFCEGWYAWLGDIEENQNIETLKSFIETDLSEEQREELYTCIMHAFKLKIPEEPKEE